MDNETKFRTALLACLDDDDGISDAAFKAMFQYAQYMDYDIYDIYDGVSETLGRVYLPEISPLRSLEP